MAKIEEKVIEEKDLQQCPVTACLRVVGGKWKPILIYLVSMGCDRFGALEVSLANPYAPR